MSTTMYMRKFVFGLPEGGLFSTRDVLNFGPRSSVDKAIYRLIDKGIIVRVVRGLFMKCGFRVSMPTIDVVVRAKASAFDRQVFEHGICAARKFGIWKGAEELPQERIFASNGASTSFLYGATRLVLQRFSPRKLKHQDSILGRVIRALWILGEDGVTSEALHKTVGNLGRNERARLRTLTRDMPQWLAERLHC